MKKSLPWTILRHLFTTPYTPHPADRSFLSHAQTQEESRARATVAVLDPIESDHYFGLALAHRGIQPVFVKIENRAQTPLRLQLVRVDPNYYTALEAAGVCHFSLMKRLSTIGIFGLMYLPFLPLILFLPIKLITAWRANRRMDDFFQSQAFHLRPIPPGGVAEGFVFTPLDLGTKCVHINLHAGGDSLDIITGAVEPGTAEQSGVAFTFSVPVPGIAADYLRRDMATVLPTGDRVTCTVTSLVEKLRAMPATTSNQKASRQGDPVNLVVVGEFETILSAFAARWDESETITLATCWKTARSFLLGSQYRYSPVSPLYLFGRSQDVALQRTRRSVNERLHLRLWLTPLVFNSQPVWVGQISRDIGVRFTHKTWNLTTHRIDPDTDEARDYVIEDLFQAERISAAGYVDGVGEATAAQPRRNLTGDPYYTDGKRAVILLSGTRVAPRFVALS